MKKIILVLLMLTAAKFSQAQYKPVEQGSTLKFTIKNLGFGVDGSFTGFDGKITFDPQNVAGSLFDVTINASSINTDNTLRDEHLRGENFLMSKIIHAYIYYQVVLQQQVKAVRTFLTVS